MSVKPGMPILPTGRQMICIKCMRLSTITQPQSPYSKGTSMTQYAFDQQYSSLGAYLDAIEATARNTQGDYIACGTVEGSLSEGRSSGRVLATMVQDCRTMTNF